MTKWIILVVMFSSFFARAENCATNLLNQNDEYRNFAHLARHESEGTDFRVVARDAQSSVSIIAPHAGKIEFGTSELARAIAQDDFNLYLFEGLKEGDNFSLHITSTRFDEPRAAALVGCSEYAVSVHGFNDERSALVIVGGLNKQLATAIAHSIEGLGIDVEFPPKRFKGVHKDNIVNRARFRGVQIELSSRLRNELLLNREDLNRFSRAVRRVLLDYAKSSWCSQSPGPSSRNFKDPFAG